jgi:chromosome segregation protein
VDFAANLMEFDGQYEDVFAYALGDTLVVEDMASARRLLKQYRMVTLDGSLMEKSGAMSGGSAPSAGRGGARFANTKKVDDELNRVLKQLDAAEAEKNKLEKGLTQLELKLDGLKEQYAVAMTAANKLEVELDGINSQLESLAAKQASQEKGAVVSDLSAERTRRLNETRQQISALEKQATQQEPIVLQLRATLEQVEDRLPSDQLEALRKSISDVKFQRDHYDSQLRNVQAEIKGKQLEKSHQEQGIQHYHERIAQTKDSFGALEKEKAACQEEIQLTTLQIKELEAQTQELDEELKKLQGERDAVQSQLIELEKQKYDHERKLSLLDEQILSFQARKRELEPQLQTAKVELVRAGQNLDTLQESDLPSEEELTKQIQSLTRKMEAMEPVNMLAIKEYDEVSARQGELSEKIETLNREREAITVKIAGYHELKRLSFMKAFENVDQNFKTIFAELSDGEGQLILTNPDDPFSGGLTIQAQPRGKKMQRLEAMSGGEKSLTSLAFVFSLQRYIPAPFYALDEVDMNLDGINAEKLANMVKRESRTAQFIVVSLRKPMIEHSDRTVGVTQKRDGGSKVTGVKLREDHDEREASPEPAA